MAWLRLYDTMLNNRKVQSLPPALFKALINLWCFAKSHDGVIPSVADAAYALRASEVEVTGWLAALTERNLMVDHGNGTFRPHQWEEHQFASDKSTDRVRKHRMKRRRNVTGNVSRNAERNVSETVQSRAEQIQSRADSAHAQLPIERLCKVLNIDMATLHRRPQFVAFPALLAEWVRLGCDPETDIWPTIERLSTRARDAKSPRYFEAAILKARDDRVASQPSDREKWATRLGAFRATGFWHDGFGPKPGAPGCLCPPDLLQGAA